MTQNVIEIEQDFQLGLQLIKQGQAKKAEELFLSIIKHAPDNPVLLERLGYCYALQANWHNAEDCYAKANQLLPQNSEILNNYGCVLQKQNKWRQALPLFRQAYDSEPENISALCNLAQTLNQNGEHEEAVKHYIIAIEKQPQNTSLRFQLAEILHNQERFEEEIAQYRIITSADNNNAKAQLKYAIALFAMHEHQKAENTLKAINQKTELLTMSLFDWSKNKQEIGEFKDATYGLGLLTLLVPEAIEFWRSYVVNHYFAFGLNKTIKLFEQAIKKFPKDPGFLRALAIAYAQSGKLDKAVETAKKLVETAPEQAQSHQTYAALLRQNQKTQVKPDAPDESARHFNTAIRLAADIPQELENIIQSLVETKDIELIEACHKNLPTQLKGSYTENLMQIHLCTDRNELQKAVTHGEECIKLSPKNSFAYSELSEVYFRMEDYEAALATAKEAVNLNPKDSQSLMRLGYLSVDCGLVREGLKVTEEAYALNPHDPSIQLSLGLINLLIKNWDRGWEMYEARFKMRYNHRIDIPPLPKWDGTPSKDLELVIVCEQGLGDIIQFSRFIPLAAQQAKKAIFISNTGLMHFFKPFSEYVEVLPSKSVYNINVEQGRWISLIEIPRVMKIPENEWGKPVPYLKAQPKRIQSWKDKILLNLEDTKIGIAWQGSPGARIDVGRSFRLDHFEKISALENISLYSLQKFHGEEQIDEVSFTDKIIRLGEDFDADSQSFADTAAVMDLMDLIITSDTSIAHLAGALGRPVWLVLKHVPDWRWHLNTQTNPAYPTMKLYRQSKPGQWEDVFNKIANDLKTFKRQGG